MPMRTAPIPSIASAGRSVAVRGAIIPSASACVDVIEGSGAAARSDGSRLPCPCEPPAAATLLGVPSGAMSLESAYWVSADGAAESPGAKPAPAGADASAAA